MTIKTTDNIVQLTNTPVRCSACFNQDPSVKHIDMDAACDRGYGDDAAVKVAYDDLVLCERCVGEAAALLGMVPQDDTLVSSLEAKLEAAEREALKQRRYAKSLEKTLDQRPESVNLDHRRRPKIEMEAPVA